MPDEKRGELHMGPCRRYASIHWDHFYLQKHGKLHVKLGENSFG